MISASLARANEREHVHNVRDFPQAKLDSEIIVRFLLDEHGDLYLSLHCFGVWCLEGKEDIAKNVHKTVTRGCEL